MTTSIIEGNCYGVHILRLRQSMHLVSTSLKIWEFANWLFKVESDHILINENDKIVLP